MLLNRFLFNNPLNHANKKRFNYWINKDCFIAVSFGFVKPGVFTPGLFFIKFSPSPFQLTSRCTFTTNILCRNVF